MMFSSIEEAWTPPTKQNIKQTVEPFTNDQNCNCDSLVASILKCPGCLQVIQNILSEPRHKTGTIHNGLRRGFTSVTDKISRLTPQVKEKLIWILFILAILVLFKILFNK